MWTKFCWVFFRVFQDVIAVLFCIIHLVSELSRAVNMKAYMEWYIQWCGHGSRATALDAQDSLYCKDVELGEYGGVHSVI